MILISILLLAALMILVVAVYAAKDCFRKDALCVLLLGGIGVQCLISIVLLKAQPMDYYLPAEIVAENETATYFGCEDGRIYYAYRNPSWPDDVPYLLHMDSKGTKDHADDEIMVVWRTD